MVAKMSKEHFRGKLGIDMTKTTKKKKKRKEKKVKILTNFISFWTLFLFFFMDQVVLKCIFYACIAFLVHSTGYRNIAYDLKRRKKMGVINKTPPPTF